MNDQTKADKECGDDVLKRMLETPPKVKKPTRKNAGTKASPKPRDKSDAS